MNDANNQTRTLTNGGASRRRLTGIQTMTYPTHRHRRKLTLRQYVERRNGVPLGSNGSLTNMLNRSLGASYFAEFWRYWNHVWGYYLGEYVYLPLRRALPARAAVVLTFAISGAIHDIVRMVIRGSITFLFMPWFVFLGLGVVFASSVNVDFKEQPWSVRRFQHRIPPDRSGPGCDRQTITRYLLIRDLLVPSRASG